MDFSESESESTDYEVPKVSIIIIHGSYFRMIYDRLADGIQKHPKAIILVWVLILVVMAFFAIRVFDVMSYDINDMAPPDSESVEGLAIIEEMFPDPEVDQNLNPILVVYFKDEQERNEATYFLRALSMAAEREELIGSIMPMDPMYGESGDGIIMVVIALTGLDDPIHYTQDVRDFIQSVKGDEYTVSSYLTGFTAISYDMEMNSIKDIEKIDPFTILLILILIGLFFRSFVTSAIPPMAIGFAFVVTMGLIFFIGQAMTIFYITNMIILVSMMGAGCDYCIFIIARYREERRSGLSHDDALHQSIVWAGESITISGLSVIIGFGAMAICDYSLTAIMGICLALGILIALLAALTVIPAILAIVGDKVFWPSNIDSFKEGGKATKGWYGSFSRFGERYFEKSSRFSLKHAKAIAITAVLMTVPAVYVVAESEDSYDMMTSMLSGESGDGMELIGTYADQGMIMPNYSIIKYNTPVAIIHSSDDQIQNSLHWTDYWKYEASISLPDLYEAVQKDDNISYVEGPFVWSDYVEMTEDIEDPDERAEFIKDSISATRAMYFDGVMSGLKFMLRENFNMVFTGPGPYIDEIVGQSVPGFDWDALVESLEEEGLTDPTEMVDRITTSVPETAPVIKTLKRQGMTDEMLIYGFSPMVDYVMNVTAGVLGGEYVKTGSGEATYILITSATVEPAMSPRSMVSITNFSEAVDKYVELNKDEVINSWETGSAVIMYDISEIVKEQFKLIEIIVVVMILILLLVVMRSYLIPLRSVLTILMSVLWTLAVLHLLFVDVMGKEVLWLVPVLLIVICLGLGMDYDILLTTRIKENVMSLGMGNDEAIHHAVVHTGSVITICGLIMGGAFGTLMISGMTMLQEIGFALCFAILVDALIVRTYIVPAIMHLLGDWNWKGPGRSRRD